VSVWGSMYVNMCKREYVCRCVGVCR